MSEVFLCRVGQLTAASRRELKRAGVVVVEVEDPSACQFIRASETVSGSEMLWAAADALRHAYQDDPYNVIGAARQRFALSIFKLIDAAHFAGAGMRTMP